MFGCGEAFTVKQLQKWVMYDVKKVATRKPWVRKNSEGETTARDVYFSQILSRHDEALETSRYLFQIASSDSLLIFADDETRTRNPSITSDEN